MTQYNYSGLFEKNEYDYSGLFPEKRPTKFVSEKLPFLDKIPDFVKAGYQRSITGMATNLIRGKKLSELKDYDLNKLEDIGATIISFFMPTDWLALGAGGKIGGLLAKKFIASGVSKQLAKKAAGVAVARAATHSISGATTLGFYSGLHAGVASKLQTGEFKLEEIAKGAGRGAVLGGAIGAVGGAMAPIKGIKGVALRVPAEITTFATTGALLEGRPPGLPWKNPDDWVDAAGIVLGLKAVRGAPKVAKKVLGIKPKIVEPTKKEEAVALEEARISAEKSIAETRAKESWFKVKGKGAQEVRVERRFKREKDKKPMVALTDAKTGEALPSIPWSLFTSRYMAEQAFFEGRKGRSKELRKYRIQSIHTFYKKTLGMEKPDYEKFKKTVFGKTVSASDLTNAELVKLKQSLDFQWEITRAKQTLEGVDATIPELPKKGLVHKILDPIKQTINRINHLSAGRKLAELMDNAVNESRNINGRAQMKLRQTGLLGEQIEGLTFGKALKKAVRRSRGKAEVKFREDVRDWLVNEYTGKDPRVIKVGKKVRKLLNTYYNWLRYAVFEPAGVEIKGYRKNYFPGKPKEKIIDKFLSDVISVAKRIDNVNMSDLSPTAKKQLNMLIKKLATSKEGFQEQTRNQINKMLGDAKAKGQDLSYFEAYEILKRYSLNEKYRIFGHAEKEKTLELVPEYYERDAGVVLVRYFTEMADRVSFIRNFGGHGQEGNRLIKIMQDQDPKAGNIAGDIFNFYKGIAETDPRYGFKEEKTRQLVSDWMAFQVMTKIAMGYATIPNITQTLISTARDLGNWRTLKGTTKLILDKKTRDLVKQSGSTIYSVAEILVGIDPTSSLMSRWSRMASKVSGFSGMNKINSAIAASTAHDFILDMGRIVKGQGVKGKSKLYRDWAAKRLGDFGIKDPKRITQKQVLRGMVKFARDSQLQKNFLKDMFLFNSPRYRPFFIFKRFGYRQAAYAKDEITKELKRGNVLPFLRLAASGVLGGWLVFGAKDKIKDLLAGEDVHYQPEEEWWQKFISGIQEVGAFGAISDIFGSDRPATAVEFFVKPVIWSDLEKAFSIFKGFAKDVDTFGFSTAPLQRSLVRTMRAVSGQFRAVSKRRQVTIPYTNIKLFSFPGETEGMRERRISSQKGRERTKILELLARGKTEIAIKRAQQWNEHNPLEPITSEDISYLEVYRMLRRKAKVRATP